MRAQLPTHRSAQLWIQSAQIRRGFPVWHLQLQLQAPWGSSSMDAPFTNGSRALAVWRWVSYGWLCLFKKWLERHRTRVSFGPRNHPPLIHRSTIFSRKLGPWGPFPQMVAGIWMRPISTSSHLQGSQSWKPDGLGRQLRLGKSILPSCCSAKATSSQWQWQQHQWRWLGHLMGMLCDAVVEACFGHQDWAGSLEFSWRYTAEVLSIPYVDF